MGGQNSHIDKTTTGWTHSHMGGHNRHMGGQNSHMDKIATWTKQPHWWTRQNSHVGAQDKTSTWTKHPHGQNSHRGGQSSHKGGQNSHRVKWSLSCSEGRRQRDWTKHPQSTGRCQAMKGGRDEMDRPGTQCAGRWHGVKGEGGEGGAPKQCFNTSSKHRSLAHKFV